MARIVAFLKIASSWLMVVWSVAVGVFLLASLARKPLVGSNASNNASTILVATVISLHLYAAYRALYSRKLAGIVFSTIAAIVAVVSLYIAVTEELHGVEFAVSMLLCLTWAIPGAFWLFTRRWLPIVDVYRRSRSVRLILVFLYTSGVFILAFILSFGFVLRSAYFSPTGCYKGRSIFAKPIGSRHTVFTAHVIYAGTHWLFTPRPWALVRVDQHSWGLPSWNQKFILLYGMYYPFQSGQDVLVDGERDSGFLLHAIPVVEAPVCGYTAEIKNSELELRLLRDGPPKQGVRIIGVVEKWYRHSSLREPLAGVNVKISGPSGELISKTDDSGIFDVNGLPPGRYQIHREPASQYADYRHQCGGEAGVQVKEGNVWGCRLSELGN